MTFMTTQLMSFSKFQIINENTIPNTQKWSHLINVDRRLCCWCYPSVIWMLSFVRIERLSVIFFFFFFYWQMAAVTISPNTASNIDGSAISFVLDWNIFAIVAAAIAIVVIVMLFGICLLFRRRKYRGYHNSCR